MVGLSRSSNSSRSCRRRLAHRAKGNDSSCCRPRSRHNLFLQTRPSLSSTRCSWFMMRVRACTIRCRCHSSCRRSRFSQLGTQIRGKRSSISKRSSSRASSRSVFGLRTRLVSISAASPIHNSKFSSASNRSNQRACPLASIPHSHLHSLRPQVSVKLFRFLAVLQPPFFILSGLGIHKRNLLEARVIIASYNDHCPAPFSEPSWLVLAPPSLLGPGSRHCYGINYGKTVHEFHAGA